MNAPAPKSVDAREAEVWASLATVTDPELDESVADMGFVESIALDDAADGGGEVRVGFRLPTFWCSPNFAFIMAHDMRQAVESLPWVSRAVISLSDHCHAKEINHGVGKGLSFSDTFPGQAVAELDKLRLTFRRKAFQRRQELLLRRLRDAGITPEQLCAMSMAELTALSFDDAETLALRARYIEIRGEFGGAAAADDLAFATDSGEALQPESFAEYLQDLRRVRVNAEFNANLCRGMLQTRYGETVEE